MVRRGLGVVEETTPEGDGLIGDHRVFRHERAQHGGDGLRRRCAPPGGRPFAIVRGRNLRRMQRIRQPHQRLHDILLGARQHGDLRVLGDRGLHLVGVGEERHRLARAGQDHVLGAGQRLDRLVHDIGHPLHRQTPLPPRDLGVGALGEHPAVGSGLDTVRGVEAFLGQASTAEKQDDAGPAATEDGNGLVDLIGGNKRGGNRGECLAG